MALETGTFISDLVVTNPAHTDGLNNADAHMRLIKSALKATFPNVNGAVASTQTQLDAAVTASVSGSGVLKDTGEFFKTNVFDGITNPSQGTVVIEVTNSGDTASTPGATFTGTLATVPAIQTAGNSTIGGNETVAGTLAVTGAITGPGVTPIGAMTMWLSDTLPPSTEGVWAWANGQAISRTTYATLFTRLGGAFGSGDGSTTFNLPDMQDVVPVGKNTMGGAAGNSFLSVVSTGIKNILGSMFGQSTVTLGLTNLPPITSTGNNTISVESTNNVIQSASGTTSSAQGGGAEEVYQIGTASSGQLASSGVNAITVTGGGSSAPVTTIQPSRIVNFIVRIA